MWNGLRLHLRDSVAAQCAGRVLVALDGGLASSLLACLAVDALGSRSVIALHVEHDTASDGTAGVPCLALPPCEGGGLSSSYSHGRARRPRYSPVVGWR
ncbi:MAG: hypothetical protein ACLT5H_10445 [Collinsella stercoris]|uniref:hypothetical protein n=1 Tax=Collinsella stercoris TaxID=147206 RepID=UPI0039960204